MLQAMSKLQFDKQQMHLRWRTTHLALKLSKKRVEDTKRIIEDSGKLIDRPVYPFDPRTAPKLDK
ncbi:hypothetical protein [Microvirga zambiensis]|uniref:hypothetical protein n=1 Tax=Microvirga zambiensis TaxID=1402137 RepID=UPI00191DB16C|nr:hypothetical protein [Microvirga zambiensis]